MFTFWHSVAGVCSQTIVISSTNVFHNNFGIQSSRPTNMSSCFVIFLLCAASFTTGLFFDRQPPDSSDVYEFDLTLTWEMSMLYTDADDVQWVSDTLFLII